MSRSRSRLKTADLTGRVVVVTGAGSGIGVTAVCPGILNTTIGPPGRDSNGRILQVTNQI